ncbi:protein far1-related sequence 5-like [Gigaspora margarita]|uniref:Protein far1-related sequence 5-like n=1 Tax=Gigaspora margarita TaxID=4874 RepID=A0A8H4ALU2_GIGMA|nr:protein far1-related sequence 5-like [Gigaspora margarita]
MNFSVQYHATRVLHENQYNNQIHEIDNKCIDDIFNYPQALTSHIYQQFNNLITIVWNIVNINEPTFPQFVFLLSDGTFICTSTFHINMVHSRWFKNSISNNAIEQSAVISISQFNINNHEVDMQLNYNSQTNTDTILLLHMAKIKQWALYGKLWSVACKATELLSMLKMITRKRKTPGSGRPEKQLRIQSSLKEQHLAMTSQNVNNNSTNKKYKYSLCSSFSHTKARCPLNANKNRQLLQQLSRQ